MTIRCIAIDDEPLALRQITSYIGKIPFLELVATFRSAVAAQEWLKENEIDLIFVDINMPDMTGVEFVQSLDSKAMVIFTTAYAEYAIEGFKLSAIDYLLKPIAFDSFLKAANKLNIKIPEIVVPATSMIPEFIEMVEKLKDMNPNLKYNLYEGVGHNSWEYAFSEETLNWKDLWFDGDPRYGELDLPVAPAEAGSYTIDIYFNGKILTSTGFKIQ